MTDPDLLFTAKIRFADFQRLLRRDRLSNLYIQEIS